MTTFFAGELVLPPTALTPADIDCPVGWVAEQYWDALVPGPPDPTCGAHGSPPRERAQAATAAAAVTVVPERGIAGDLASVRLARGWSRAKSLNAYAKHCQAAG